MTKGGMYDVSIKKDRCSPTWIITATDLEGYHRQINMTKEQMRKLILLWQEQEATL
jgi:hypothetical protein